MIEVFLFIFGLCIGSFLNVLIDRLPKNEDVMFGQSHCDYCHKTLRWYELVPVFSYIFLLAKCNRCHKKLSFQYPLLELITGVLFIVIPYNYLILVCAILVIFVADIKYQIIPDQMLIVILLLLLPHVRSAEYVIAAGAGLLFFWLLWFFTKGKGMGFGDVKLAGVIGFGLGFPETIIAFYVAFLTGALLGVILILGKRSTMKTRIAFGPFLIMGTVVSFLYGQPIYAWWQRFFI